MSNVITLKPKALKAVKQPVPEKPRWFCLRCDSDVFKLYEIGSVHCVGCGSRISGLEVRNAKS